MVSLGGFIFSKIAKISKVLSIRPSIRPVFQEPMLPCLLNEEGQMFGSKLINYDMTKEEGKKKQKKLYILLLTW